MQWTTGGKETEETRDDVASVPGASHPRRSDQRKRAPGRIRTCAHGLGTLRTPSTGCSTPTTSWIPSTVSTGCHHVHPESGMKRGIAGTSLIRGPSASCLPIQLDRSSSGSPSLDRVDAIALTISRRNAGALFSSPAMIKSWETAGAEFVPFLELPVKLPKDRLHDQRDRELERAVPKSRPTSQAFRQRARRVEGALPCCHIPPTEP